MYINKEKKQQLVFCYFFIKTLKKECSKNINPVGYLNWFFCENNALMSVLMSMAAMHSVDSRCSP